MLKRNRNKKINSPNEPNFKVTDFNNYASLVVVLIAQLTN